LWHKVFKISGYTEGYACEFLKTFHHQHLNTPHPQKLLNSGISIASEESRALNLLLLNGGRPFSGIENLMFIH
jgi:hypothetical protein